MAKVVNTVFNSAQQQKVNYVKDKFLRLPDVKAATGLSRSTIYKRISEKTFPTPISLGPRSIGFLQSEVEDWLTNCVESSRSRPADPLRNGGAR